jgi:hypothetical protein
LNLPQLILEPFKRVGVYTIEVGGLLKKAANPGSVFLVKPPFYFWNIGPVEAGDDREDEVSTTRSSGRVFLKMELYVSKSTTHKLIGNGFLVVT